MKRHEAALAIQQGACNPSGIAYAIIDACREIRSVQGFLGTKSITHDPAVQLMVHQLAFICGLGDMWAMDEWEKATTECRKATAPPRKVFAMVKTTKAQRKALLNLWKRSRADKPSVGSYLAFRRTISPEPAGPAIMVPYAGMIVGIEPDGYTHS